MKKTIIVTVIIGIIIVGAYLFMQRLFIAPEQNGTINNSQPESKTNETQEPADESKTIIGISVERRDITAYHYGTGDTEILFIGGIHGGYAWNSVFLAYQFMDYLEANENVIPDNIKVTVIPVLNPDGLNRVVGTATSFLPTAVSSSSDVVVSGRFNANGVDLNRNFDCDWKIAGVWQNMPVSGGGAVFSEPESQAFKNYIETHNPAAVVVWDSAAGGVFASDCGNGIPAETRTLTGLYADASGYKAYDTFDFYEVSGDLTNWLARKNIPAISALMTTHDDIEWSKNLAGINAVLNHYAK
ncbi:MAG: hypothetical protein E4H47_00635 [Parcubacteria group bacterium]|nr:MAG: hypothetical protein E4H47_00635 [Parcubacteria group bacterium]